MFICGHLKKLGRSFHLVHGLILYFDNDFAEVMKLVGLWISLDNVGSCNDWISPDIEFTCWLSLFYPWQAIKALIDTSEGDMRKAITCLQSAARLKGQEEVTKEDIYEIAGVSLSSLKSQG